MMATMKDTEEHTEVHKTISHHRPESQPRRLSRSVSHDATYDLPTNYDNLDELAASPPIQNVTEDHIARVHTLEENRSRHAGDNRTVSREARRQSLARTISRGSRFSSSGRPRTARRTSQSGTVYDIPDNYVNLDELATSSPVENPDEEPVYVHKSLEEAKEEEQRYRLEQEKARKAGGEESEEDKSAHHTSRFATQLYTISYLIFFSFLGTLARLGLQDITFYPGAPTVFSELWANVGGSMFMGFLSEDRMLFREEWGTPTYDLQINEANERNQDEESSSGPDQNVDLKAAKKAHAATKKTIPLYIGLATGFCGCFTSFSSFIRDSYLAMANALPTPLDHPQDYSPVLASTSSTVPRNGGYSFMALLAVVITTVALSISGLHFGAHLAILSEPYTPSISFTFGRKVLDRLAVFLAWGCWLGAILLAIFPPNDTWRGRALFALIFAPLGCLGRFYLSLFLNGKIASFPLGTFVANIFGTAILGMNYDLQHVPLGGVTGCQVLQGVEDGFCGCLTTVSTWVSELSSLRRRNSYRYGGASVVVALCFLIVIMGSMQWTIGFSAIQCSH